MDAEKLVANLRGTYLRGHTRSYEWRRAQLLSLLNFLHDKFDAIAEAVYQDIRKPRGEVCAHEAVCVELEIRHALSHLKKWMRDEHVSTPAILQPGTSRIVSEPMGVVLIIGAWNFPLLLVLNPLVGALAAGNTVALKPSEVSPATSALLARYLPMYLDREAVQVVEGGVPEVTAMLEQKWDFICFTGSTSVGRIVAVAAAKLLTPVLLELGGKTPVIIDRTANIKTTVARITLGRYSNSGQICLSPDYVLAPADVIQQLIPAFRSVLRKFYTDTPQRSGSYCRIVSNRQMDRITKMLDSPATKACVVLGGSYDKEDRFIEPTILKDVPWDEPIMQEEIFGPILILQTVESVEEAISIVNSRPKPLSLYMFSNDTTAQKRVESGTSSGAFVINDAVVHALSGTLPFGGVGDSGMGSYHGKWGFDAFSHKKAVLWKSPGFDAPVRYPPWTQAKEDWMTVYALGDVLKVVYLGIKNKLLW